MEPFRIDVADSVLDDLRERVRNRRLPRALPDVGWDYGTDLDYLDRLCAYWTEGFDWRKTEARLNSFSQVRTRIDGTMIHAIHERSALPDAVPLLLLHGWPSTVYEFHKVIGPLTSAYLPGPAFHVVCPSLPGYGWSDPPTDRGWDIRRMGTALFALMRELGYEQFAVQGGDWGALIATEMGLADPTRVIGLHLSMVLVRPPTDPHAGVTPAEQRALDAERARLGNEMAYDELQSTKPDTLAAALTDSPVGLASWVVEKLRSWSDGGGDPEGRLTRDDILSLVTTYWVTGTAASSMRLYYEYSRMDPRFGTDGRVEVPTACALFPADLYHPPRAWVEQRYDLRQWHTMERGGHFAALEEPVDLVADVRQFFGATLDA